MKKRYFVLLIAIAGLLFYYVYAGRITANTDTYIYALPFERGSSYEVVQGYGGLFTHQQIAALDFAMPEGTPVCAAREGTVYSYKDDSHEGGLLPGNKRKANYLIIRHDDGSFGCHWHLRQNGVVVKKGRVSKGQLIGYSGSTHRPGTETSPAFLRETKTELRDEFLRANDIQYIRRNQNTQFRKKLPETLTGYLCLFVFITGHSRLSTLQQLSTA